MGRKTNPSNVLPNEYHLLFALTALFKENFSIDWIVELTEKKPSQVLFAFEEGIRQGWLTRKGPGVFCFADLKEREKLQAHLPPEEKERMHRRIVELLMRELPEDDNKAPALANHLFHISNDSERCRWLLKAGDIRYKAFRIEEALQWYAKVIEDLSNASGEEIDLLYIEAAIKYSKTSTARHDTKKTLSILKEATARAKRWNKQCSQALLQMHLAKNEWLCSHYHNALNYFEKGWCTAKKLNDHKLLDSAITFSTFFLYWQGRFKEAVHIYEKSVPDVEKFPQGRFPLLAFLTVGRCYAHIGQFTQGLGMLDTLQKYCRENGDKYLAAQAQGSMGLTMLDIRRVDDAISYLECSVEEAKRARNEWTWSLGRLGLAFAYYIKEDKKRSIACLRQFIQHGRGVHMTVRPYPYFVELCWAMEEGKLPYIAGLSLEKELRQIIRGENIFMKGVAYRYQALLQRRKGIPHDGIIQSLNQSRRWLEESGQLIELSKSQLELARQYLAIGDAEKTKELTQEASKILSSINEETVPDELRALIEYSPDNKNLIKDILRLGQEVVTIRDIRDLVQNIISMVNKIAGAERGAIFLLEEDSHPPKVRLRASKNLISEQINHQSFSSSMKMIEEVALTGKGRILGIGSDSNLGPFSGETIRSRICVPMILRSKVVGVLYHDNRLLSSAFKESDLDLLAYFAAQAAIALDNARAYEEIQRLNQKLNEEKLYYEEQHLQSLHFEDIVGESPAIREVLEKVDQVAKTDATVLILGETGVGKELVARAVHRHSPRGNKPFIRVFCSSLPESLIPSELFGHERGAFTGAVQRRIGRFELADGGTLFLDEIGDLLLEVQLPMLRVLQTKEFERVGGSETLRSDFRLIAATNRDLEQAVRAGKFRPDLYYRLNVFPIYVPPLRERKEDIPLLAHYFLRIYANKMGKTFEGISKSDMDKLIQYDWSGNIRELENIIERGTILSHGALFRVPELGVGQPEFVHPKEDTTLSGNERRHILWALQKTGWKVRGQGGAAELLKIHPSTLAFRIKKLGIQRPPRFPPPGKEVQQVDLLR